MAAQEQNPIYPDATVERPTSARVLAMLAFADRVRAGSKPSLPIGKLALRRIKKRRAIAVAQALAMTLAVALPLALQFVSTISADTGYQAAIDVRSPDSLVTIEKVGAQNPQSYQAAQDATQGSVQLNTGNRLSEVSEYGRVSSLLITTLNGQVYNPDPNLPRLSGVFYPQLEANAVLVSGAWPAEGVKSEPIPVAISALGADFYGLHAGDAGCLESIDDTSIPRTQTCFKVTGLYRPKNAADPFWLSAPSSSDLAFSKDGYWLFQELIKHVHSVAGRVYLPNRSVLTVSQAPALERGVTQLRGRVQFSGGQTVLTTLDHRIAVFLRRTAVNQFPVQLVAIEVIAVVLYGLAFITQSYLGSQAQQAALWRIRGWSRLRLFAFLTLQFLILAVPAILAALAIAFSVTWLVVASHHADFAPLAADLANTFMSALAMSILATLVICFALSARFVARSVSAMRKALGTTGMAAWWRTWNLDLVLAGLAVPVLAESSLRAQEPVRSATPNADPIGIALPILGLAMLSGATLRLLPLLARPIRVFARGVPGRLSFWRLSRQSAEHVGAAMVLSLTLAVGVFASVYDRTETSNAVDRADYATGADVRIAFSEGANPGTLRSELAQVKDWRAMTPVLRQKVYPSGSSETITALGIDPASFAAAAWSRPNLSSPPLAQAVSPLSAARGYLELGKPLTELTVYVRGLNQPGTLEVDLRDAAGQRCACSLGSLNFAEWRQLHLKPSFPSAPQLPLRLYSFVFTAQGAINSGDFALSWLQAVYADSPDAALLERFENADGWWVRDAQGLTFAPGTGPPLRLQAPAIDIPVAGSGKVTINAPFTGTDLPMLMSGPTMSRLGLRPGMTARIDIAGREIATRVAGTIDYVPTLYPGNDDFVVFPLDRMASAFSAATTGAAIPNELWVSLTGAGWASAQTLGPTTAVDFVVNRRTAEQVALNDPVLIQLRANLAIGFASALALAVLSFTVHFLIATRRRLAEHSVLQANGLDPEDIRRGIAIEQVVLVVFAVLVGVALTAVEINVLLSSLQLGSAPEDIMPPTVLRFDLPQIGLAAVLAAALIACLAWLTRRIATAVNVVEELRRLG